MKTLCTSCKHAMQAGIFMTDGETYYGYVCKKVGRHGRIDENCTDYSKGTPQEPYYVGYGADPSLIQCGIGKIEVEK